MGKANLSEMMEISRKAALYLKLVRDAEPGGGECFVYKSCSSVYERSGDLSGTAMRSLFYERRLMLSLQLFFALISLSGVVCDPVD